MKAYSRGAKRRSRRGRPPLPATDRQPNGQPSRRIESVEKRAMDTAIEARQRQAALKDGEILSEKEAANPRRGYALGLLRLDGRISEHQHDTGLWYGGKVARYYGLVGIPFPSARAQELFSIRGYSDMPSAWRADQARRAANEIMIIQGRILSIGRHGREIQSTLNRVCVEDIQESRLWPEHMIAWLRHGLDVLTFIRGGQPVDNDVTL